MGRRKVVKGVESGESFRPGLVNVLGEGKGGGGSLVVIIFKKVGLRSREEGFVG